LINPEAPDTAQMFELPQCYGQGLHGVLHLVFVQPVHEFLIILEAITATLDGRAHISC
jgi:hypothetical protein